MRSTLATWKRSSMPLLRRERLSLSCTIEVRALVLSGLGDTKIGSQVLPS